MLEGLHKNENPEDWKVLGFTIQDDKTIQLHIDNDDGHISGQDITGLTVELDKELLTNMLDYFV